MFQTSRLIEKQTSSMQAPFNVIHCLLDRLQKSDEFRKDV